MSFLLEPSYWKQAFQFSESDLIPSLIFALAAALLLWWLLLVCHPVKVPKTSKKQPVLPDAQGPFPPVSLVIAAHNEFKNLEQNLDSWLQQDYPEYEVVVIDDRSTDDSHLVLLRKAQENPRLKIVHLDPEYVRNGGKKLALTLGFKKAQFQYFILTDADCKPSSDQWLRHMCQEFKTGIDLVIAPSPLEVGPGFLGGVIHFETLLTHLHFLGWGLRRSPYMGLGRNMAYTRQAYDRVGGFSEHHHIPAGDDDLFVQSTSNSQNTAVVLRKEAFTTSPGARSWKAYTKQKMRHLWVGKLYPASVSRKLSLFPISQLILLSSLVFWWFESVGWVYPALATLVSFISLWIILHRKGKQFGMTQFSRLFPLHLVFYSFWYLYMGIRVFFTRRIIW
jgi:biofilm PGA synthesis N-glycosyltransferase PgaC